MAEDDLLSPMEFVDVEEVVETPEIVAPEADVVTEKPEVKAEPMVPLAALQAERAEARLTKDRLSHIEATLAQVQQQRAVAERPPEPDIFTDPEAYKASLKGEMQQLVIGTKLEQSRFIAEREYGADRVKAAYDYFEQHPEKSGALLNSPSPFHAAVEVFEREKVMAEFGNDPVAYQAKLKEQLLREILADQAAQSVKQSAMATAPSLAGQTNLGTRAAPSWNGPTPLGEIFK